MKHGDHAVSKRLDEDDAKKGSGFSASKDLRDLRPLATPFRRDDRMRASLPVVGVTNKSMEQPLGTLQLKEQFKNVSMYVTF